MKFNILLVATLGYMNSAQALESIMFTPEEVTAVNTQRQVEKLNRYRKDGVLICNGILYFNEKNWTVWLNNKLFIPQIRRPEILIHHVTAQQVELTWRYKGEEHRVCLPPNQGYDGELRKFID